jgi:hypothetical protein
MPIPSEHDAVESECIDSVLDIWPDVSAGSRIMIGLGGHTRDFAMHIPEGCQFSKIMSPWVRGAPRLDWRLADVIENEAQLRA